jgi:hypothetical protein
MSGLGKVSGIDEHITGWQLAQLLVLVVRVRYQHCKNQCCGSVIFWYRSGSADPYSTSD